jgi:hypothetical protein
MSLSKHKRVYTIVVVIHQTVSTTQKFKLQYMRIKM